VSDPGQDRPLDDASPDLAAMRAAYRRIGVDVADLGPDPVIAFGRWFAGAVDSGIAEPNAMVLATVGQDGWPAARTVLLKGYDERGLRFFTNLASAKAAELAATPRAAVVFPWHALARQVRVTGAVVPLPREEVEAYWATRPRDSQLGAWASPQSEVVESRAVLDAALASTEASFPGEVPLPEGWGGYRLVPEVWEFWAGREGRLHDRLRYRRTAVSAGAAATWTIDRLAP
jgi:pyridoxamine 5'-phosphate oxidase